MAISNFSLKVTGQKEDVMGHYNLSEALNPRI